MASTLDEAMKATLRALTGQTTADEDADDKPQSVLRMNEKRVAHKSSIAGTGSGDFHVYREQRRRELLRTEDMDREAQERLEKEAFVAEANARRGLVHSKHEKAVAKRQKRKARRKNAAGTGDGAEEEEEEEEAAGPAQKRRRTEGEAEEGKK